MLLKQMYKNIKLKKLMNTLKSGGGKIGKITIFDVSTTLIDCTRPWLISIGDYTKITRGCTILTHDYSLSVLRRVYGEWIGEGKEVIIGKNCFIGVNSTILMGTQIGDNCIVGAGSVVHGKFPSNVVIAGNPAKIICSLDEHYKKRKESTKNEAINCARIFYERNHRLPEPKDLPGFKFLFMPRDKKIIEEAGLSFFCNGDKPSEVEEAFYNSKPIWNNFEEFLSETGLSK